MKKFFAVVLGLALVLGVASIASAELTAEGKLVLTWTADLDGETYGTDLHGDTEFKLKLSNSWDNASASITLAYDEARAIALIDDNGTPDPADDVTVWGWAEPGFVVDGYEFAYAFSDQFTFKAAKSFEVKTPIWDDASIIAADIPFVAGDDEVAFIGEFTLDGGWVKAATNLDPDDLDLAVAAEFAFDPVTVGGVVDVNADTEVTRFGLYAKYALTDEITLIGDFYTNDPASALALKASYAGDPFTAAATIKYDLEDENADLYWKIEGSYAITDATTLSANYDQEEAYEIKLAHTINEGPVLSFAYNQDEDLTAKIEASF